MTSPDELISNAVGMLFSGTLASFGVLLVIAGIFIAFTGHHWVDLYIDKKYAKLAKRTEDGSDND